MISVYQIVFEVLVINRQLGRTEETLGVFQVFVKSARAQRFTISRVSTQGGASRQAPGSRFTLSRVSTQGGASRQAPGSRFAFSRVSTQGGASQQAPGSRFTLSRVSTQGGASRQVWAHGSRLVVCLHKAVHPDRPELTVHDLSCVYTRQCILTGLGSRFTISRVSTQGDAS